MTLVIALRTTKLIDGGHRGLQAYRPICYYLYVFYVFLTFFSKFKKRDFLRFFAVFHTFSRTMDCSQTTADHTSKPWREYGYGRWAGTVPRRPTTNSLFITPIISVCCHTDHFLTKIWAWRDLLKTRLKQFIRQDLAAQNSCWMTISSFDSLTKMYLPYPHCKIHIITDYMQLLEQRRKMSQQNAFFVQE